MLADQEKNETDVEQNDLFNEIKALSLFSLPKELNYSFFIPTQYYHLIIFLRSHST